MDTVTVAEACKNFSELMAQVAYARKRVLVERRGKPMMAMVSIEDLQRSAYHAFYLALAEWAGCELWTANRRLYSVVTHKLPWVKCLCDYRQLPDQTNQLLKNHAVQKLNNNPIYATSDW